MLDLRRSGFSEQANREIEGALVVLSTNIETVEALYRIADQQRWLVGEMLERALAALQRELAGQGAG